MADTKISALPASTTPLAGTEVLPIVQSGTTKQVSVANLTAGRAVSAASVTASTGNFVVGTSGQGVDFSATPGTGTSELLSDYEEGTFTPSIQRTASNATITYTAQKGWYTKVGNVVHCDIAITWSANSGGSGYWELRDLPFVNKNAADHYPQAVVNDISNFTYPAGTTQIGVGLSPNQAAGAFIASGSGVGSNVITTVGNAGGIYLSITYLAS